MHIESFDEDRMIETNGTMPPPPHDIEIVRGSAYGIFSRGFVEFVVNSQLAQDFLEWSRSTYSPDEHFWSTLHHNYANPHVHVPGSFRGMSFLTS